MRTLIGLVGLKGCGKDTAADMLAAHGFARMAFADELYREVARAYAVTPYFLSRRETKETPLERLALKYCWDDRFVGLFTADEVCAGLEFDEVLSAPRSPRWLLQQWGTEYRRKSRWGREDYWVDPVMRKIDAKPRGAKIVLADVREAAEVHAIAARGGHLVRIRRRKVEEEDAQAVRTGCAAALHSSETLARECVVDFEVQNVEGDPHAMRRALESYLARLKSAA